VVKVRIAACIQNTQLAGTRPDRPSSVGGLIGSSKAGIPEGTCAVNVMAIGAMVSASASTSCSARRLQSVLVMQRIVRVLIRNARLGKRSHRGGESSSEQTGLRASGASGRNVADRHASGQRPVADTPTADQRDARGRATLGSQVQWPRWGLDT